MKKNKILIVAGSFYPEISPRSFRTTELAKELARQGNEVVVYIPFKGIDYSDFLAENPMQINYLGTLKYKAIKLKGNRLELLLRRAVRRALNLLFAYPYIEFMFKVSKSLKYESGYDLLISIAVPYPIHWGVAKVRSNKHKIAKTWIADCGDPFMGITADTFRKFFYFKYIEKWFCRKSDFITIPFEGAKSGYYPEFHEKIRIIPQGFRIDNLNLPDFKKTHNYPCFAYSGGLFPGQHDPRPLLNFLSEYKRDFKIVFYTSQTSMLLPFKRTLGAKLIINEYVPREDLLRVLSGMDFLINFSYKAGTQLPHKLIDYAITGRPVLNIASDANFSSLLEFLDGNYAGKMDVVPKENYDIRMIAEKFTRLHTNN